MIFYPQPKAQSPKLNGETFAISKELLEQASNVVMSNHMIICQVQCIV